MRTPTLFSLAATILGTWALVASPAAAQQRQWHDVRESHGAWQVVCETPEADPTQHCVMLQPIVDEEQPEIGLLVVVMKSSRNDAAIVRVLAPLGVLLPLGMDVHVDERPVARTYFARCFEDGCWVMVEADQSLLDLLKGGDEAVFTIYETPEEGIGIPVDLDGFTAGFEALPAADTSMEELLGEGSLVAAPRTLLRAQDDVQSNHGAWDLICEDSDAVSGQCAIVQSVVDGDEDDEDWPAIGISMVALRTAEGDLLRVLAPLGVLLPHGLGLTVDGADIGRTYFVRCSADACYAEVTLDDQLLGTLRGGEEAVFIVFETPGEGIGIPVDLDGFAEGFDALPQ